MTIQLPASVQFVIGRLEAAGFEAYAVGGCIRDTYLGKEPYDWDITTSALPEQTKAVFADCKTVDTGIQHGTVTVVLNGTPLEVTTYRIDGDYKDNRHPDQVTFTRSLKEDLARRDFTMNALAYCERTGVVDEFEGRADLAAGLVRCVGEPDRRFQEDALRILRGLRFAAVLGFALEPETADSIHRNGALVRNVSPERIQSELRKLVLGQNAGSILETFPDVLRAFLPDFRLPAHLAAHLENAPAAEGLRLALLFEETPSADALLKELRLSNVLQEEILSLLNTKTVHLSADRIDLRKAVSTYGADTLQNMIQFREAKGLDMTEQKQTLSGILERGDCCNIKDLAVGGRDLQDLGIRGRDIGVTLQSLLTAVMEDTVRNERGALLDSVKSTIA